MAARNEGTPAELRVLRSPHHGDRRTPAELAAIDSVEALHVACVENQRCLVQTSEGVYLLARRADTVEETLGLWLSASGADEPGEDEGEEFFQPLPFQGGRGDSPRLIILGLWQGKFTHGYTGRDYWVTDVEANDYGVRALVIAPSPSGAISRGRSVRRTRATRRCSHSSGCKTRPFVCAYAEASVDGAARRCPRRRHTDVFVRAISKWSGRRRPFASIRTH